MGGHDPKRADTSEDMVSATFRHGIVALLPELRAFGRFLSRDRTRADDLVQETIVRAFSARHQFEPGSNLKTWTFTILRNLFYEQTRRGKREQAILQEYSADQPHEERPQAARSRISDLERLLWQLPPLQREALMLVGAQELSYEEAAIICGVAVGTLKARVSRARSALAELRGSGEEGV